MATLNPREELVSLLRGFFSCPIISSLGKKGILNLMMEKPFTIDTFPEILEKNVFASVLKYFVSLELIKSNENDNSSYTVTEFGQKIFCRYGSFNLLNSYGTFLSKIDEILFEPNGMEKISCDRLENVIGSGQTNGRKFFPKALEIIKTMDLELITDIGCGNGDFLSYVLEIFPEINVIASDVSQTSVDVTLNNLRKKFPKVNLEHVLTDASDVESWAKFVAERSEKINGKTVISMWYLIHEISKSDENFVIEFFNKIHKYCPLADIIIGEIINIPEDILAKNKYSSIMPEFLFFHEISGQGVLSWQQYHNILDKIPYKLENEVLFDLIKDDDKELPTGFIWHLHPKKS